MEAAKKYNKIIGENLRKKRIECGNTQEEVAKALGVTFQQIQKYEIGKNRISAGSIVHLAEYFGCPVVEFFSMPDGADIWDSNRAKRAITIVKSLDKIENLNVKNKLKQLIIALGKETTNQEKGS